MENRIKLLFQKKDKNILNIYFTAGFPKLDNTIDLALILEKNGVDLIEIGMPYSDPLADGLTIQKSSEQALKNGMNLSLLFEQIKEIRSQSTMPIILMGYLNQWMQFGKEKFCKACNETGVDGLIIPDLPMDIYEREYKTILESFNLCISFLVCPQTSIERIWQADKLSTAFVYLVSQSSITGKQGAVSIQQNEYYKKIESLKLKSPRLIGFGIHDKATLNEAWKYANGAIIGSAFIRAISKDENLDYNVQGFLNQLKSNT